MRLGAALGLLAGTLSAGIGIFQEGCPALDLFLSGALLSGVLVRVLPGAKGVDWCRRMSVFCLSLGSVPLSVGVVRGLRGCAVPIACVLLLAYGVLVPMTLRQENAMNEGLKRVVQHEGRYMAELAGKQWPGATR